MNKIEKTYYSFIDGIKNLFRYFKIIWHDRDWDYCFMLMLERKKLKNMIKWYEDNNYGIAADGERYYNQMKTALNCLNIVLEGDWWNIIAPKDVKWFNMPPSEHDKYYNINAYVNINNYKRFCPWIPEFSLKNTPNLWKVEIREQKAWHIYCKLREQYMRSWWD